MAGIGTPLYVDRANTVDFDRATIRMTVQTSDPALLPPSIVVNLDNKWQRCPISLIRWEIGGIHLMDTIVLHKGDKWRMWTGKGKPQGSMRVAI